MIGAVGLFVTGVVTGNLVLTAAPIVYLTSRVNRDVFLAVFSVYVIALGYFIEVDSVFTAENLTVLITVAISSVIMLDEGLAIRKPGRDALLLSLAMLSSAVVEEVLLPAVVVAGLLTLHNRVSKKGLIYLASLVLAALTGFVAFSDFMGVPGSQSTQVSFLASLSVLISFPLWFMAKNGAEWAEFVLER